MNSLGVSLASDSVVSFGESGGRTYPTLNKIFSLSGRQPIGIMICGAADCPTANLPWERIIGKYREHIGSEENDFFREYFTDFATVLLDEFFKPEANDLSIRRDLVRYFTKVVFPSTSIRERMNREFDGQVEYYIPEVKDYFELALEERIKQIHQQLITEMEDYKKFGETGKSVDEKKWKWYNHVKKSNPENTKEAAAIFCERHNAEDHRELLEEIFMFHLVKYGTDTEWKTKTHIVFAGFSKSDNRPHNLQFTVTCNVGEGALSELQGHSVRPRSLVDNGQLLRETKKDWDVFKSPFLDPEDWQKCSMWSASAFMLPYAVQNEMNTLLNGIHPLMYQELLNSIPMPLVQGAEGITVGLVPKIIEILQESQDIDEESKEKLVDAIGQQSEEIMSEVRETLHSFFSHYSRRELFRNSVTSLPLNEITDLARFLVSTEANMMHWTSDENTVGGPVDVAIITKEDGFVWVDTKQSYDPMKNPRHMDIDRSSSNFR
jgi:hypothetical protein